MSGVIATITWVVVVPFLVVHGNPHLWRIPVVKAIATSVVLLSPEVLRIVDIRVVVEPIPVAEISLSTPAATIRPLVGRSTLGQSHVAAGQHGGDQKMTKHHCVPPRDVRHRRRGEYRGIVWQFGINRCCLSRQR